MTASQQQPAFGALVVSLDFELHWGWRDVVRPGDAYYQQFADVWQVVPQLLALFEQYDIAATWATVGFLFAESRAELEYFSPEQLPQYTNQALDPYQESLGETEVDDPYHFAPSLITQIQNTPRQEIGTHTFSHYYAGEAGQTLRTFKADIDSAIGIAAKNGIKFSSIIFPRNQDSPAHLAVLRDLGIMVSRGRPTVQIYQRWGGKNKAAFQETKLARYLDALLNLFAINRTPWLAVYDEAVGVYDIPSTAFLRPISTKFPVLNRIRLRSIKRALTKAAQQNQIVHLWWHPHNFSANTAENLQFLQELFQHTQALNARYGFQSLTMEAVYQLLAEQ